jgi:hypothetical protein
MELIMGYWKKKEAIILAIDRTSWQKYNLLVVSWIIQGRAIPILLVFWLKTVYPSFSL